MAEERYPEHDPQPWAYKNAMTVLSKGHYCSIAIVQHEGHTYFNVTARSPDTLTWTDKLGRRHVVDPKLLTIHQHLQIITRYCIEAHDQAHEQIEKRNLDPGKGTDGWINSDTGQPINPDDIPEEDSNA